jgi:hypothetical protein
MQASLNAVDIANTEYNIASDFNVIYILADRTCVRNGLRDFSITLYNDNVLKLRSSVLKLLLTYYRKWIHILAYSIIFC